MGTQIERASMCPNNTMVIGICLSCDGIDMVPLHNLSHMPCHDHLASDMHYFGCCPFSPYDVSNIAHVETPIVSSYMLGDCDPSHPLHDPTNTCVHNMLPIMKILLMLHILVC